MKTANTITCGSRKSGWTSDGGSRPEHGLSPSLRAKRSNPWGGETRMDCFVANAPRNDEDSRLRLPLPLPSDLVDLGRHRQGFGAAAIAGAAHWRRAEIIQPDGDAGMRVGGADAVCRIEADPAEIRHECFRPGVAGLLIDHAVGAQEMSGDETRRHAAGACAGDNDMRVVLAHPALQTKGFDRRGAAVGGVFIKR